jgi:hypothetical protein
MTYTHADFSFSDQKAIDDHFINFSYPQRISFTESELAHIYHVGASILMTKHGFQQGGSFVQSIVANNLREAFNRADSTMLRAMRIMSYVNSHAGIFKADPKFELSY